MAQITLKILMDDSGVKKESENLKKVLSEAFQPITKINTSGIENLRKSYANLLNTIKTNADKFPADTFKDVREQTELALSSVIKLSEKLRQGGELSKEETQDYAKLSNQIKTLSSDFATLRAQTERLEKVETERVPKINTLQKSYARLRTTLKSYSAQYGEETFGDFSKKVQDALDSVTSLKAIIGDTEPDEEQKRQLIDLGHEFENLSSNIETLRANSDKLPKIPKEYIPDIDKLQSKYAQLLKRLKDLSSQYPENLFADATNDAKTALETIKNLPSFLSEDDKDELRFLEDYSDTLKAQVDTILASAEKLEKIDIFKVSNQYSGLIEKINSIKEKYPQGTFDDIAKSANAAFDEIRSLNSEIGDGKPTDTQTKKLAELEHQYRRLNSELNTAKIRTEKLQKEQKISAPSVDALRKNIANLFSSLKTISSSYPAGTFTEIADKASSLLKRIQSLNTEIGNQEPTDEQKKALIALQQEYQSLSGDIAMAKATTDQYTGSIEVNGDSIFSSAKKFMMWQSTATLVMTGINLLRNAFDDLNETLVLTEDKVIAIARVLPETGKTNAELADRLYDVGADYARSFGDVSEIAQNFAQSGYDFAETVKATEAAVLALNVAELNAEQSSEGLISVLSQFDKKVYELIDVVDVLNKTADTMPVTTEELLAGLQKSGSYAKTANMSLEETTAILASLSKATAASGSQIGNALKSLIAYTTKTEALDLFAGMSEKLNQTVKEYRIGTKSILDVWQTLSEEMNSLSAEQFDLLDKYTNESGLENEIGAELTDIYEDLTGVYDTAGVYRKNYFIALMQELGDVEGLVAEISDSAGYSAKENEKYLDTYSAKVTTLQSKWQAMLNDEQGFLEFKKDLVDAGILLVDFTDKTGGLLGLFLRLSTLANAIWGKQAIEKIGSYIDHIKKNQKEVKECSDIFHFAKVKTAEYQEAQEALTRAQNDLKNAQAAAKAANEALNAAEVTNTVTTELQNAAKTANENVTKKQTVVEQAETAATNANTAAKKANAAAISTVITLAMTAIVAIQGVASVIQNQREEEKLENEKTIEAYKANREKARSLEELYRKYQQLSVSNSKNEEETKELYRIEDELVDILGDKAKILDTLTKRTEDYSAALRTLSEEERKTLMREAVSARNAAEEEIEKGEIGLGYSQIIYDPLGFKITAGEKEILKAFDQVGIDYYSDGGSYYLDNLRPGRDFETQLGNYELLSKAKDAMKNKADELNKYIVERMIQRGKAESDSEIEELDKEIAEYTKLFDELTRSYAYTSIDEHLSRYDDIIKSYVESSAVVEANRYYDAYEINSLEDAQNALETVKKQLGLSDYFDKWIGDYISDFTGYNVDQLKGKRKYVQEPDPLTDANTRKEIISALEKERDLQKESEEYAKHLQAIEEARTVSAEKRAEIAEKTKKIEEAQLKIAEAEANLAEKKKKLEEAETTFKVRAYDHETGRFKWDISIRDVQAAQREKDDAEIDLHNAKVDLQDAVLAQKDAIQKFEDYLRENDEAIREAEQNLQTYLKEEAFSKVLEKLGEETTTTADILAILQTYLDLGHGSGFADDLISILEKVTGVDFKSHLVMERSKKDLSKESFKSLGLPTYVYDDGGVLHGIGGIKATKEDEGVIPPPLMKKILKPDRVAEFERFLAQVNHALEMAHINSNPMIYYEDPLKHAEFRNFTNYDRHDKQYIVNGVPISPSVAETHTIKQLFETMALIQ